MTSPRSPSRRRLPRTSCPQCISLRGMNREHIRQSEPAPQIMVRSFCRVCGRPALVGLPSSYDMALRVVYWIDDQVMDHEEHTEAGGWGWHWRLDDVLRAAFPSLHLEDVFPMPNWYPYPVSASIELPVLRVVKKNGVDRIL